MKKLTVAVFLLLLTGSAFANISQESVSSDSSVTKSWFPGDWVSDRDDDYRYDRNGRRGWLCVARSEYHDDGYTFDSWMPWNLDEFSNNDYYYARANNRDEARSRALSKCSRDFSDCEVKCNRRHNRRRGYRRGGFFF
ncbi:MAG: hypothetical protein ISR65_08270 [Bacteriovoracaceae bacterium]|nr:hypothetical protein [Bacteriovoracaceae bacterium]